MNLNPVSDSIRTFFEDFEKASNTFEPTLLSSQFSDPFMTADPDGRIQVVRKDEFVAGIAGRQTFFQAIGFQFVKIAPFEETRLAHNYVMVKTHGSMRFEKISGQPVDIDNDSLYVVYIGDIFPKIVFSLTHENLMQIMQKHGLIPETL